VVDAVMHHGERNRNAASHLQYVDLLLARGLAFGAEGFGRRFECRVDGHGRLDATQAVATGDFFRIALLHYDLIADDNVRNEIRNLHALGRYVEATDARIDTIAQ